MWRAAVIWAVTALPLVAQDAHGRLEDGFDRWLDTHRTQGVIATGVRQDGAWTVEGGGDARELASVAKAITGVCALALVEEGLLDWSDTVRARLGKGPKVTVAQLVTHSSGLLRDSTQMAMPLWLDRPTAPEGHNARVVLDIVAERGVTPGASYHYAYNNENYALLALMIEAAGGAPYVETCWPRLGLGPGIAPGRRTAAFGPWGGLVARPEAYLEFLHRYFGPGSAIAEDPFAFPHAAMGGGAHYGLGMVFRRFGAGYNFWHFGALCFPDRLNAGSFAVVWEGRTSAVALYDGCVDWDAMVSLDNMLAAAAFGRTE